MPFIEVSDFLYEYKEISKNANGRESSSIENLLLKIVICK